MKGFLSFILIFLAGLVAHGGAPSQIALMVGEQKTLPHTLGQSATLTNSQILAVKQTALGLLLIAKKQGKAFLNVGKRQSYEVSIYPTKFEPAKKALEEFIDGKDLTLSVSPSALTVKGEVQRYEDWVRASAIKNLYPRIIKFEFTALPHVLKKVQNAITKQLEARSLFSAKVETEGQTLKMTTTSKDKRETRMVAQVADQWGLDEVESSGALELRPMVEIEMTIAEVKKTNARHLGLSTPTSYSATVLPSSDLSWFKTTYDEAPFKLNTFIGSNMGKVIANPKILCRSGESAHFLAGGEIPIKLVGFKAAEVVWKKYGVILDISPLADIQKGISTKLVTEVSLLDEAHKIDGIPGLYTNRIETHFDLRGEKTIALSGLIKNELGRGSQDTPLLSSIPILGELFKSKEYKEDKTELVIFVTPRVISPDDAPAAKANGFWNQDDDVD